VLLSLGAEIRQLSGERLFSAELLLMEQIFGLLLAGFHRQQLPGGRVALVPPQPGSGALTAPAAALDQVIAALVEAAMGSLVVDGQPAVLCFTAGPLSA